MFALEPGRVASLVHQPQGAFMPRSETLSNAYTAHLWEFRRLDQAVHELKHGVA